MSFEMILLNIYIFRVKSPISSIKKIKIELQKPQKMQAIHNKKKFKFFKKLVLKLYLVKSSFFSF